MYLDYFRLQEPPFSLTSHPKFFFPGANRAPLLEGLRYAVYQGEGILKISGEVGVGKSMICRMLIEALPARIHTVYLVNPRLSPTELLVAIATELRIDVENIPSGGLVSLLQRHIIELFSKGKQVVVLIDEAHAMPQQSLEEIRLLSNLETGHYKLLQIVLFGQPELDELLAERSMRQLRERISYSFLIPPMTPEECREYVHFRMKCAGGRGDIFDDKALEKIAEYSGGLTRRINLLADKSLLAAFIHNSKRVTVRHVELAHKDSNFSQKSRRSFPLWGYAMIGVSILSLLIGIVFF